MDASVLVRLVGTVSVAAGGLVVFGSEESGLAGAADVPVLGRLVGTVDVGIVDVGAVDVGAADVGSVDTGRVDVRSVDVCAVDIGSIDVAPTTDETGTTEFSWTALDDALA